MVLARLPAASAPAYVDFANMDVDWRNCRALRFLQERKIGSSETNPVFSNCHPGEKLTAQDIPLLQHPPRLLQDLVSGSTPRHKQFPKSIFK